MDAVLFMLASDHVPEAKEDELEEIFKLFFLLFGVGLGVLGWPGGEVKVTRKNK